MSSPVRVLIVDDSAFVRKVLRELLGSSPDIEVVGIARDGLEALEKIAELTPDVMTLDLMMPHLDGLGVLEGLPAEKAPGVIVVSISDAETELGAAALQAGALDIVRKPTALASDQLYEIGQELIEKVKLAALARPRRLGPTPAVTRERSGRSHDLLVIGTSTGGPQAITRLLAALPRDFPVPIVIALHIPAGYTEALAARLDASSALTVREAAPGMLLEPGLAVLARGGSHVRIVKHDAQLQVSVDAERGSARHAPSVDYLFTSAAEALGAATLGAVLTGMGDDGLLGARAIHEAGGHIITESESSCVVYGMPRCVYEAGYSTAHVMLADMAETLLRHL